MRFAPSAGAMYIAVALSLIGCPAKTTKTSESIAAVKTNASAKTASKVSTTDPEKTFEESASSTKTVSGGPVLIDPDQGTSHSGPSGGAATVPSSPVARSSSGGKTPARSNQVFLGDPSLTAGIPGEGPLTLQQIDAWLSDPASHEVLEIELPMSLAAAASQMKIPADNPLTRAKIELGRQLYFDPRLSSDHTVSCASCHAPQFGYAFNSQFGIGVDGQTGNRNSPVAFNRILSDKQFWDGRASSLEEQAKGPIANPIEMANTHEACIACLAGIEGYRRQFEKVFGPDSLNIDNVAKAIASFERALVTGPSPYDYYERFRPYENLGEEELDEIKEFLPEKYAEYELAKTQYEANQMSEPAMRGLKLFLGKAACAQCHSGVNFSDELYHNLGVGMEADKPDLGRYEISRNEKEKGAFKTPTLRNITQTAPYMHDGSQATLEEVIDWYDKGGHGNATLSEKIKKLNLTDQEKSDLVEFMKALTGPLPKVETGRLPRDGAAAE